MLFDDDYLAYWPMEALPLASVQAGAAGTIPTAIVSRPGCLDFAWRRLTWIPAGTGACPGTRAAR